MNNRMIAPLSAALFLIGCAPESSPFEAARSALTGPSGHAGLLAFLNDQANTTVTRLDYDCQIRSDSAKNIIKHRDGSDKAPGTGDDNLFDTYYEVEGVPMVGPWTMARLSNCAWMFGYMKGAGPTLGGRGTAAVNGQLGAGEWDGAAKFPFNVELTTGSTIPAYFQAMNDDSNLYLSVVISRALHDQMVRFLVLFDNDSDGFVEVGEDRVTAVWSPYYGGTEFGDSYVGGVATRAWEGEPGSFYYDTYIAGEGGTSDGAAATGGAPAAMVIELRHPLNTADDLHDFSLAPGSRVALSFAVGLLGTDWVDSREWASVEIR